MPAGTRVRSNNVYGIVNDNPLLAGSVTFNSNQLTLLPTIISDHAVITLDPLRQFGDPEIVIVTAHATASTVATIQRAAYGTSARDHPMDTVWVHAALDEDFTEILTSVTRPTDPYRGQKIFETDTNRYIGRSTADVWQQEGLFFDPPACRVFNSVAQALTNGVNTVAVFNSEEFDTDLMHDNVMNNSRITFNTPGIYIITYSGHLTSDTDYTLLRATIRIDGTTEIATNYSDQDLTLALGTSVTALKKVTAGQYVEVVVTQANTSAGVNSLQAGLSFFSACWIGRGN